MTATRLYTKISTLTPTMIKEVNDFVEFLMTKQKKDKVKESLAVPKDSLLFIMILMLR